MNPILARGGVNRVTFDPSNPKHQKSLRSYLKDGNWGDIQFFSEEPFMNVPATVMHKFCLYALRELAKDRAVAKKKDVK